MSVFCCFSSIRFRDRRFRLSIWVNRIRNYRPTWLRSPRLHWLANFTNLWLLLSLSCSVPWHHPAPKKPAAAEKSTPAKKPATAKKSTPAKKPAAAKKSTTAKKPAAAKKSTAAKKPVGAKKATPKVRFRSLQLSSTFSISINFRLHSVQAFSSRLSHPLHSQRTVNRHAD